MELEIGQLVRSKAGRDYGRYYLVWEKAGNGFVRLVDGQTRRLENPKLKNVKHLQYIEKMAEDIAQRIATGQPVTNAQVRKAIGLLAGPQEPGKKGRRALGDG